MFDLLTATSILIATVTWMVTYVRDVKATRVAHTSTVLSNICTSERLASASACMTRLINARTAVSMSALDRATEESVIDILDYYEFVCDLYATGTISKTVVIDLRGKLMKRTWQTCEQYVKETRALQGRPVYCGFERFVATLPSEGIYAPTK